VPETKIVERYHRSLALLPEALARTDRAFLFDTSEEVPWYFAEVAAGTSIEFRHGGSMPNWFEPAWTRLRGG
jgi:predicted ABC-type ATPase